MLVTMHYLVATGVLTKTETLRAFCAQITNNRRRKPRRKLSFAFLVATVIEKMLICSGRESILDPTQIYIHWIREDGMGFSFLFLEALVLSESLANRKLGGNKKVCIPVGAFIPFRNSPHGILMPTQCMLL